MSKYAGDVCVISGSYQNKDGEKRNRYLKLGSYFKDDKGRVGILLQAVPVNMNTGKDGGTWLTMFPAKPADGENTGNNNNPPAGDDDEVVPF